MTESTHLDLPPHINLAIGLWLAVLLASTPWLSAKAGEADKGSKAHAGHLNHTLEPVKDTIKHSEHAYQIPPVKLTRQDGTELVFPQALDDGRAVVMNFVFTTCNSICPMLSHTFQQVQTKLGNAINKVHLVSISIDPEQDTPEQLRSYAKRFKAGPSWDFYTGSVKSSVEVQKAFDVFRGDKMNHAQIILIRTAPGKPWTRLEGFIDADTIVNALKTPEPKTN